MKSFFFLILGLVLILGSIFLYLQRAVAPGKEIGSVEINDVNIQVEVANTPETRAQGLSGRATLADGSGMLFIFPNPASHGFWMKDMHFAIDIIWIDEGLRVIGVEKEVTPDTFPRVFYPNQAVKYVLEVPAGFLEKNLIDIGQVISFSV